VEDVIVRRGQAARVNGRLRPALAFLGVYGEGALNPATTDSQIVARRLALRMNAFVDPHVSTDDVAALRKKGLLPIEDLLAPATPELRLKSMALLASRAGHAETLLFGIRTGDKFVFRLYNVIQPEPDLILIPNLEEPALDFLVAQINRAEGAGARLQTPDLELDLLETAKGLVVLKDLRTQSDARTVLAPGTLIRSIDQKKMSFNELQNYIRGRKPGQPVTLEVSTGKETSTFLPVSVVMRGAEYPWNSPDGVPNAVTAIMNHLIERDPESLEAKYASLGVARGLMLRGNWNVALQFLARAKLETVKSGVGQGTVLYYQGRCYEELGDRAQALLHYTRAKEYPDATLGTIDGLPIGDLAERRIQVLQKKSSQ
jgi:tetratricopeptide (TPR) repeat protein